jgi:hypothetical protein
MRDRTKPITRQEVHDLRRALRNDPNFNDAAKDLLQLHGHRRKEYPEEFWKRIYDKPFNQFPDERLNMIGQGLNWSVQGSDDLYQLDQPPFRRFINTEHPQSQPESCEEVQGS